ncbi:MAG: hypothetical protein ACREMN_13430 [Gemmatimonadales bacterium]
MSVSGEAGAVSYGVDAGSGVDRFRGVVLGGGLELQTSARVRVSLNAAAGTLDARTAGEPDRRLAEIAAATRVVVRPWLQAWGELQIRTLATDLARQQWILVTLGAEARPPFSIAGLSGVFGLGLIPIGAVTSLPPASFGVSGIAGFELQRRALTLSITYELERFDFPPHRGVRRHEQNARLTVRGTLRVRD